MRVRRRHHGSYRGTVIALLILMGIVAFIGHKTRLAEIKTAEAETLSAQLDTKDAKVTELAEENQALKDKLEASAKIVTSDTVKQVTRFYLNKYFGKDAQTAEKIFTCESNLNPNALNDKNKDGSVDRGVAQINSVHASQFQQVVGVPYSWGAHDTELNIKFAKWIFDTQGGSFNAWVCSKLVN